MLTLPAGAVLFVLLLVPRLYGSTAIVMIVKEGIVIGTDGKFRCVGTCDAGQGVTQKVQVIHNIIVASIGISGTQVSKKAIAEAVRRGADIPKWVKEFSRYDFPTWMKHVESTTDRTISVADLAERIRTEAETVFPKLVAANKRLRNNKIPINDNALGVFLVTGYENYLPALYVVRVLIDPAHKVKATLGHENNLAFYMPREASRIAIGDFQHPTSCEFARIKSQATAEVSAYENRTLTDTAQAARLLHVLISEEIRVNGNDVGLPMYIATLPYVGLGRIESFSQLSIAPKQKKCQNIQTLH